MVSMELVSKILPTVTVAIPSYNEAVNIERVIQELSSTQYENLIEIFVADGESTDGTQDIIARLALKDPRIKLLNNPFKIQSAGLNLLFQKSKGDVFLRADAHADYAPDYIEQCIKALLISNALNVGGAQRFVAKTPFQAGVALASRSPLGNGGAKYRNPYYSGYSDTVFLGCFWRDALQQLSGYDIKSSSDEDTELNAQSLLFPFDTSQVTNQDAELNHRLQAQKSSAIYISSKIKVWYYPRKTWIKLWIQYFKYGRGRCLTTMKHPQLVPLRSVLPFLVISGLSLLSVFAFLIPMLRGPTLLLFLMGLLIPFLESVRIVFRFRESFVSELWRGNPTNVPSVTSRWFYCGLTILMMPIAHFSGYAYQLLRQRGLRALGW
jgi:succinoglycan biosynthesis protein ExoA